MENTNRRADNDMKRLALAAAAAAFALFAQAKEIEQISVVEGESTTITTPFAVKSYAPSNKDVARVEALGGASMRITGLKRGRCDLDVLGDNSLAQKYEITVVGDLASVLETLTMDLDTVPEVRAEIRGNFIRLDGEVSSIQKWEYLEKVLANYGKVVKNFAVFSPGPEILLRLKETFAQKGFETQFRPFAGEPEKWPMNTVALDLNKRTRILSVQSRLMNAQQRAAVMTVLRGEPWLAVAEDGADSSKAQAERRPYAISTILTLPIDSSVIRLSVAYMVIGESDIRSLGDVNNEGFVLDGVFNTIQGLLRGQGNHGNVATLNLGLNGVVKLLGENGINRVSEKGYTTFGNWDEKGARFKSGGVLNVRVSGAEVADLKEIPYGFEVKAKGGLVSADAVSLDMNISVSSVQKYGVGDDIDKKEDVSEQKIRCTLGRTTLLSGFGQLVDQQALRGFPVLRNTPVIKWFVGADGKSLSDRRLVIMVCPEVLDPSQDGNLGVDNDISIPVQTEGAKTTDERLEERKRFSGFWSWLNWFCW